MATVAEGTGGKLRRKLTRRTPTPYDRPPASNRAARGVGIETSLSLEGERRRGWISKLVDPASAILTKGATRLFSSVFRKRLGAPPAAENLDENLESEEAVANALDSSPTPDSHDRETHDAEATHDGGGISEFEQLLKQKTFTREEYERLTELLRSRTVDLSNGEDIRRTRQSTPSPSVEDYNMLESEKFRGGGMKPESSFGALSASARRSSLNVSEEELASPAEVAKAYMGSRPSKISPSSLTLRSEMLRETTTTSPTFSNFMPKLTGPPLPSKSVVRFPGLRAIPDNGYTTPVSRGRSAIYRMSRSPYFRAPPSGPIKEDEKIEEDFSGPSHWTPKGLALSSGKQVLKRRSTVLESDIGSVGPIRRIRQKSNLLMPVKSVLDTAELPLSKSRRDALENGEKMADYIPVPTQSREMANKILQQLDKLVPSPKDKPSETKTIFRDESPSKLTLDMLHGQASKTFTEKDLSKLFNAEANGLVPSFKNKPELTGPSTASIFKSVEASEAKMDIAAEMRAVESLPKKPAFKMQVPVEMLDFENNDVTEGDNSSKIVKSDAFTANKPYFASAQISEVKLPIKSTTNGLVVPKKDAGFTFQVSSVVASENHLPATPTMPSPPVLSAGPDTLPVFSFSSRTPQLTFSSTLASSAATSSTKEQTPEIPAFISTVEGLDKPQEPGLAFKSNPITSTTTLFGGPFASAAQSNGSPSLTTSSLFSFSSSTTSSTLFSSATPSFQFSSSIGSAAETKEAVFEAKPSKESNSSQPTSAHITTTDFSSKPSKEVVFGLPNASASTTTKTFDFASKPSKESIFSLPNSSMTTAAFDFASKSSKESIFSLPSTMTTTTVSDFASKPSKESIFSLPSASTATASDFASKSPKETIFSSPSTSMATAPDFAPKPSKESIFGLPTSSTLSTDLASKPSKESIFGVPTSAAMTTATADFAPKSANDSIFSLPTSAAPTTATTDFALKPSKESIFVLPTSTDSTPKPVTGSIFGLPSPATTSMSAFASTSSSLFGGTGTALVSQSSASQFTVGAASSSIFGAPPASSLFGSGFGAASSAPAFSYPQAATPASPPVFGFSSPFKVATASPGNDQMSVEDSMADDTPVFGGSTATVFPFGSPQPSFMQNPPSPFQPGPGSEFQGNFSMGSGGGGGDKSGRRFIKAKRDKHRKK